MIKISIFPIIVYFIFGTAFTLHAQQKLIHYWHFNNLANFTTVPVSPAAFPTIKANFSTLDTNKAVLAFKPLAGTAGNVLTYWDNVSPGDTVNARLGQPAGLGFRPRNPSDSMQLVMYIPTTGYQNITIKFETQRSSASNGAATDSFDYSLDSGSTWRNAGLSVLSSSNGTGAWTYPGISVNISNDVLASNNNRLVFRIRFIGPGNTGTSGNIRFDNITIEGDSVYPTGSFINGNLAVLRVGDSLSTLANTGNFLAIDQLTFNGNYLSSYYLPRTGTNAVTLSSTASSEGMLTQSGDGTSMVFFAYRTPAPYISSLAATTSATVNRAIVNINSQGLLTLPAYTASGYSANNPRTAFGNGTGGFWGAGANTGISYSNTAFNLDTVVSSTVTNIRSLNAAGGQLYFTSGSGTAGLYRAGNGMPTGSGNVSTVYIPTGTGSSPYAFAMKNDSTVCYIADDRASVSGGGIQKWTRSGSTWTLAYTLNAGNSVGTRGLVVNWKSLPYPTIFATTAEAARNRVVKFTDSNSTANVITLDTAAINTIFRGITFTPGSVSLPVKLARFEGKYLENNAVLLTWKTASEINNKGFYLQRSTDGEYFENIAFIKGTGNSSSINEYQFTDLPGKDNLQNVQPLFYRLNQIDFDGISEYSKIIIVNRNMKNSIENLVHIFPNPVGDNINISLSNPTEQIVGVEIKNILGEKLISLNQKFDTNTNIGIDIRELKSGLYFIIIGDKVMKFIKD